MQKKVSNFLLLLCAFLVSTHLSAQQSQKVHLSLHNAIKKAIDGNELYKQAQFDALLATSKSHEADATFFPKVEVSYNAFFTDDPLNAFGFKLHQRIATQEDFMPSNLNHPGFSKDFSAKFSVQQPLLNMDAVYERSGARKMAETKKYSAARAEEYLVYRVKEAYLRISLAKENVKVLVLAHKTAASFLQRAEHFFEQGLIQQSDVLETKAYTLKMATKLQTAESDVLNCYDQLSLLLDNKVGTQYEVENIHWDMPTSSPLELNNRNDLKAFVAASEATNLMEKSKQMKFLPRINAFGTYQFNDQHFFSFGEDSYLFGVSLSWTIFDGTKQIHQITSARIMKKQAESKLNEARSKAQADYEKALRQLKDVQKELQQVSSMVKQTSEAFRIQKNRYEQGLSSTSDLLRVQTQLAQQRLSLAMTKYKKNMNIAWMQFTSSSSKNNLK